LQLISRAKFRVSLATDNSHVSITGLTSKAVAPGAAVFRSVHHRFALFAGVSALSIAAFAALTASS
jgi:hypothetical protein